MTNALTLRGDMIRSLDDLARISTMLFKSGMLPQGIKNAEQAAVIILKGRELGFPMMEAFAQINVIQGKPTLAPQGMIALVRSTGLLEYLKVENNADNTATTVRVKRKGEPEYANTFTDKDADAMGLLVKDNWKKQKRVMREWRTIGANFRVTFADVTSGMYQPEELGAEVNDDGEFVETTATVVQEQPAPSAPIEQPKDEGLHWTRDPKEQTEFGKLAAELGINRQTVNNILQVDNFFKYTGTREQAEQALRDWHAQTEKQTVAA